MTLCMAAICWDDATDEHRIVFAWDRHAEVAWAGGNVAFKFSWGAKNWPALIAGEASKAEELLATCRATFKGDNEPLTGNNIFDKFNEVSSIHKEKLCRRFIRQQLGITFDRFLTQGENELPPDLRARLFHEMGQLEYGCDVLIYGFTWRKYSEDIAFREPHIIEIDRYGGVFLHQNFACIGTGAVIANSTLYQREQTAYRTLEDTLYHLYEASRLAHETAPGVGQIDEFLVVDPPLEEGGRIRMMHATGKCLNIMEEVFQTVSPKPLPTIASLEDDWFTVIEEPTVKTAEKSPEVQKAKTKRGQPSKSKKSKGQQ